MLVLICLFLVIFVAMAAMSLDVAYMNLTQTQLRAATDAAARAGGEALSRLQSTTAATSAAQTIAAANIVAGKGLSLAASDVTFGISTQNANGSWSFTPATTGSLNTVQVQGRRTTGSPSGAVKLFFGHVFGTSTFQPTQTASVVKVDRDICLVLDRSSSMKLSLSSTAELMDTTDPRFPLPPDPVDSRWAALTNAVAAFVSTLATTTMKEQVAVCSFASAYSAFGVNNTDNNCDQTLSFTTSLANNVTASYGRQIFNGATDTAGGLNAAITELTSVRARPYARKIIIHLTDGFTSVGSDPMLAAATAAADNIVIYTITFASDMDESQMIAVAAATGGQHYSAPDEATLIQIFQQIATSSAIVFSR
jgi:hypothetical protein